MDEFTFLSTSSKEVVRVTPDGKVWLNDDGKLTFTGLMMPVPIGPTDADYAFKVMHALARELATYQNAKIPEANHAELVKHMREESFDCPLCAQAADYLDALAKRWAGLTARNERLTGEAKAFQMNYRFACDAETKRLTAQLNNAETKIGQFQSCITKVAEALGGVACGGVDSSSAEQMSNPASTTRVLCDAIKAARKDAERLDIIMSELFDHDYEDVPDWIYKAMMESHDRDDFRTAIDAALAAGKEKEYE